MRVSHFGVDVVTLMDMWLASAIYHFTGKVGALKLGQIKKGWQVGMHRRRKRLQEETKDNCWKATRMGDRRKFRENKDLNSNNASRHCGVSNIGRHTCNISTGLKRMCDKVSLPKWVCLSLPLLQ
jgi:hypothetical protein